MPTKRAKYARIYRPGSSRGKRLAKGRTSTVQAKTTPLMKKKVPRKIAVERVKQLERKIQKDRSLLAKLKKQKTLRPVEKKAVVKLEHLMLELDLRIHSGKKPAGFQERPLKEIVHEMVVVEKFLKNKL